MQYTDTYQSPLGGITLACEADRLTGLCDILGLMQKKEDALPADIQQMVDERAQARKEKNWKRSDELRDAIKAAGYVLEDTPQGQYPSGSGQCVPLPGGSCAAFSCDNGATHRSGTGCVLCFGPDGHAHAHHSTRRHQCEYG